MDISELFNQLLSQSSRPTGTPTLDQSYNPASRVMAGPYSMNHMPQPGQPAPATPTAPAGADAATRAGYAIMPNTMSSMGKGGASGG